MKISTKTEQLAIIILSCDKFCSLWPLFFKRLNKHFPPVSYKFYLLSNKLSYKSKIGHKIKVIRVGEDVSWSDNLYTLLNIIKEKNVLLLMEDGVFCKDVDKLKLEEVYKIFLDNNMSYLNLKASPKPDLKLNKIYGMLSSSKGYRAALVPSIWKKSIMLKILKRGESAWQFEIFGSERSKIYKDFYSLQKPIFLFDHIIIKGKIERKVFKKLKQKGEHQLIDFPLMSHWEYFQNLMIIFRSVIFSFLIPDLILTYLRKIKYGKIADISRDIQKN